MTQPLATADTERPAPPPTLAQCRCCGSVFSRDMWQALPSRRPWEEFDLEIAECTGCRSTISVEASHAV